MDLSSREQFIEAYAAASEKIKNISSSEETAEGIATITNRHGVQNQAGEIARIVGHVLVGLIPMKNFIQALQEEGEVDAETAKRIAYDIRNQIFAPVAEELASLQGKPNLMPLTHNDNVLNLRDELR